MKNRTVGLCVLAGYLAGVCAPPAGLASEEIKPAWSAKLQAGRRSYENLEFDESSKIIREVVSGLVAGKEGPESIKVLSQAYLYLGMVYLAQGLDSVAREKFMLAYRLDPSLSLSPRLFSPGIISLFREAQKEVEADLRSKITLDTEPAGAQLFFDGKALGPGPVALEAFTGVHYLWAEADGFPPKGRTVNLVPGEEYQTILRLEAPSAVHGRELFASRETPRITEGWKKPALFTGGGVVLIGVVLLSIVLLCGDDENGEEAGVIYIRW